MHCAKRRRWHKKDQRRGHATRVPSHRREEGEDRAERRRRERRRGDGARRPTERLEGLRRRAGAAPGLHRAGERRGAVEAPRDGRGVAHDNHAEEVEEHEAVRDFRVIFDPFEPLHDIDERRGLARRRFQGNAAVLGRVVRVAVLQKGDVDAPDARVRQRPQEFGVVRARRAPVWKPFSRTSRRWRGNGPKRPRDAAARQSTARNSSSASTEPRATVVPRRANATFCPTHRKMNSRPPEPVWKSTSASGALSHFSAMTRPSWLGRAVRNSHRHAVEQASRRWRGGRRDDSARTRRKILISTQAGTRRSSPASPGRSSR